MGSLALDIKNYNEEVQYRNLFYLIGLIIVVLIGIIRAILAFFCEETVMNKHELSEKEALFYCRLSSLEEHNLNVVSKGLIGMDAQVDLQSVQRKKVTKACCTIRDHVLTKGEEIKGTLLKTKFTKLTTEDLIAGKELETAYMTQDIDFGELNETFAFLFRLNLKKSKKLGTSYVEVEDGAVIEMEAELRRLLMNSGVTLKLIEKID